MRKRVFTKRGLIRFLSSSLEDAIYSVEVGEDFVSIRRISPATRGTLGVKLNIEVIDYLISRGATL